jgi:glycosyltransferase involved in cell wall biosynthesis
MPSDLHPSVPSGPPPKVSVVMVTYNHERFIAQAIESVLMQRTTFPVELVLGEDCSTDDTRRLVLDYQRRHPDKIRLLLLQKNVGACPNFAMTVEACRGEYLAFCEGDDYWTHPEKLQRQIDYMEAHPEMALCHHTVDYVRWEGGCRVLLKKFPPESDRGDRQANDLIGNNFIQTCSLMIRRSCLPVLDERFQALKLGDWPLCYLAAEHGKIGFLSFEMADYRIHESNTWSALPPRNHFLAAAQMAFYLATVAQSGAQEAWRNLGIEYLSGALASQPTSWGAARQAWVCWRSEYVSFSVALSLLARDVRNRSVAKLRRYPRVVAALKYILRPRPISARTVQSAGGQNGNGESGG